MNIGEPKMTLATNIRRLRKKTGWSQEMLAHFAGLHATEISRLERGLREPRLRTVMQVAAALKVTVQDLIEPQNTANDNDKPEEPII